MKGCLVMVKFVIPGGRGRFVDGEGVLCQKVTLLVPVELWALVKEAAAERGVTVQSLIWSVLGGGLSKV